MKRVLYVASAVLFAGAMFTGCDEAPVAPPELLKEPPRETQPPRPTTQALLEGPRKRLTLGVIPLAVRAPASWGVKHLDGTNLTMLEGPTPTGDVSIQLSERPLTSAAKFDVLVNGAKRELEQFPATIKMAELRAIGRAKVLERQRIGRMPTTSPDDEPGTTLSPPFSWTITVFVPRGADYETYELSFIGLTADQYETDKVLLRSIIESLTVDGGDATTAPVNAATTPR
jgi:hypothetical protein